MFVLQCDPRISSSKDLLLSLQAKSLQLSSPSGSQPLSHHRSTRDKRLNTVLDCSESFPGNDSAARLDQYLLSKYLPARGER